MWGLENMRFGGTTWGYSARCYFLGLKGAFSDYTNQGNGIILAPYWLGRVSMRFASWRRDVSSLMRQAMLFSLLSLIKNQQNPS